MFSALSTSLYVCVVLCVQPSAHTHTHKTPRAPRARAESDTDYYVCSSVCPRALMFTRAISYMCRKLGPYIVRVCVCLHSIHYDARDRRHANRFEMPCGSPPPPPFAALQLSYMGSSIAGESHSLRSYAIFRPYFRSHSSTHTHAHTHTTHSPSN